MNKKITKTGPMAYTVLVISMIIFASACKTRQISMQLLVPAEINLPQEINTVAILNCSLPDKRDHLVNVLEGFISGESILADREGSFKCIQGLEVHLNESPRLKAISIETDSYRGTGTRQFPELLDWDAVDVLSRQYKADAIIALETFDSDFEFTKWTSESKEKQNGKEVVKKVYHAKLKANVNSGWRIYDNIHKKVFDQTSFNDRKEWSETGPNAQAALDKLPSKRHAINESGTYAGIQMANRVSPNWRTERRTYFVKGNKELQEAKEQVKFNNWDAAILIWKKLSDTPDLEISGRACYNLALASERKGDIDAAIYWAEKAMKDHHIKKARNYVDRLSGRKHDEERLKEQMK